MVREEIVSFIESEIVPRYDGFDPAHRRDHVMTVMSQAMELYSRAPEDVKKGMDQEVLLMAAACHDLGLVNGRESHHLDSGKIIRSDERLRKWFDDGQIETIAQAAEDHRAFGKSEPRSIYGKMVAEADRALSGNGSGSTDSQGGRAPENQVRIRRLPETLDSMEWQRRPPGRSPCPDCRPCPSPLRNPPHLLYHNVSRNLGARSEYRAVILNL